MPNDPQLAHGVQSSAREAWRMFEIIAEFVTATERLRTIHPAVTIFGSARVKPGSPEYLQAEDIAPTPTITCASSPTSARRPASDPGGG